MSRRGQGPDWEWRDGALMLSAIAVCCLVVDLVGTAGASVAADPKPPELVAVDTAAQTDESGDRFEPNDRQSTATGVETGESYDGLSIHTAGDRDYFAVDVDAGETIAADVAFAHAAGDLDVGLVDGSGTVLASSLSVSDDESLTHAVDTAGPSPTPPDTTTSDTTVSDSR